MRTGILQEYQAAEAHVSPGFESHYQAIIVQYEQE